MPDDPLLEEYKILLPKIDKIGDYRFIVRGWSATIVLGLLFGSSAANVPNYIVLLALPIVGLFYLMELNQNNLQVVLMKRAAGLERTFQAGSPKTYVDPNPYAEPIGPVPGIATAINRSGKRATRYQRAARRSDSLFYWAQVALILIAFGLHFVPGAEKKSPGNLYYFNTVETPQTPEKPNGKPEDQRSKSGLGEHPKSERKTGEAQGRDRPR